MITTLEDLERARRPRFQFSKLVPWITVSMIAIFCFVLLYAMASHLPARQHAAESEQGRYLKWERLKTRIHKVNPAINASEAADAILDAAENHPQNVYLLAAVYEVESRYNSLAVGKAREGGMAQIHPNTARELKVAQGTLSDPYISADTGAKYLARHLAAYSTVKGAVVRYNGGGDPDYAQKVMERYLEISGGFQL